VGCLAIAGIPPFSGFFSKDEIIAGALEAGDLGVVLGIVGILGAGLTAFYMFRLYFRAFWGPPPEGGWDVPHPHAHGPAMGVSVTVLAIGATFIGWLQVPGGWHLVDDWLEPALTAAPDIEVGTAAEVIASAASVALCLVAIGLAWWVFVADPGRRQRLAGVAPATRELLLDQYRFDDVYEAAVVEPGRDLGDVMTRDVERYGVLGAVEGVARSLVDAGRGLRAVQTGLVRAYAFAMIAGAAILGVIFVLAMR
jgi:NADH-quinone oxidoreductase subunit L